MIGIEKVVYYVSALGVLFFFFSSRRRHTRWNCDWSSDVCSSDLDSSRSRAISLLLRPPPIICSTSVSRLVKLGATRLGVDRCSRPNRARMSPPLRSEERRVGKEGRSRLAPYH